MPHEQGGRIAGELKSQGRMDDTRCFYRAHVPGCRGNRDERGDKEQMSDRRLDIGGVPALGGMHRDADAPLPSATAERAVSASGASASGVLASPVPDWATLWGQIRAILRAELGANTFESWIEPAAFHSFSAPDSTVILALPTRFMANWVDNHFGDRIAALWRTHQAKVNRVRCVVGAADSLSGAMFTSAASDGPLDNAGLPRDLDHGHAHAGDNRVPSAGRSSFGEWGLSDAQGKARAERPERDMPGLPLKDGHRFDSFIVGPSNRLACGAARAFTESAAAQFNPLFIHGATGLGKTHLVQAVGWEMKLNRPGSRVIYLSAEQFMIQFLAALRARDNLAFKKRLRACDLLIIDDVQFIAGKTSTEEEFIHTVNEILGLGKLLAITADRSPGALDSMQERGLSRLAGGLVVEIAAPDYDLRLDILQAKMRRLGGTIQIGPDVLAFLAEHIGANVRELDGAFNRIIAHAQIAGQSIDLPFVRHMLADLLRVRDKRIAIDEIQRRVADYYAVRLEDMLSPRRTRELARPRQVAMYLAKKFTPRSLPEIGRCFGGRDHTTVMHAVKRIEGLRADDHGLDSDIDKISRILNS